jgi:hypothetical protein
MAVQKNLFQAVFFNAVFFATFAVANETHPVLLIPSNNYRSFNECIHLLLPQILNEMAQTTRGQINGHIGAFADLKQLMKKSGVRNREVQIGVSMIESVLENNIKKTGILANTAKRLRGAMTDTNKLVLCALSPGCSLIHGDALHAAITRPFKIVPLEKVEGESVKPGWMEAKGIIPKISPSQRVIILSYGDASIRWILNFFHESTHFADFDLVTEWLNANLKGIAKGGWGDETFRRFARINDNELEIDEGFLRIFLESRAYNGEVAAFKHLIPIDGFKQLEEHQRKEAMKDIEEFKPITQSAARQMALSESNVFEVGEKLGEMMETTIAMSAR